VAPLIGEHPLSKLPAVARGIVEAATRVLRRDGFQGLTLRAVAAEANAYGDAIRYYFGGKRGLLEAVSLNVSHDLSVALMESVRSATDERERVQELADVGRRIAEDTTSYRLYWELLPHILAEPDWMAREAEDYEWVRRLYAHVTPPRPAAFADLTDPNRAHRLTSLMVAVVDGLALQKALDPEHVDLPAIFALWAELLAPAVDATFVPRSS
jgi:AcrR family transcriptional regulator